MNFQSVRLSRTQIGAIAAITAAIFWQVAELRADYVSTVLADSPVAYWRLGELSGTTAVDSVGGFNGTYLNGVTLGQPGAVGSSDTAAGFDGVNDKVDVPFSANLNPSVFSIEAWAKVAGGAGTFRSPLTSRQNVSGTIPQGYILYAASDDTWQFWTGSGLGSWNIESGPGVVVSEWTHLVGTHDGTTQKFYVNGALVASAAVPFSANPSQVLRIGAGDTDSSFGDFFFNGAVDEVAIYNTALSLDRVQAHFAATLAVPEPASLVLFGLGGCVLLWRRCQFSR